MIRYLEYCDRWPTPNLTAAIVREGPKAWRVTLTDYRRKRTRIDSDMFYTTSLTSAQGKARSFVAKGDA